MRPAYPEGFRREATELPLTGLSPSELAESLGVSQQTLRNWRRQAKIIARSAMTAHVGRA